MIRSQTTRAYRPIDDCALIGDCHGGAVLDGSYADRARRAVRVTFGWRGVVAAMVQSCRNGRVASSRRSRLAWP